MSKIAEFTSNEDLLKRLCGGGDFDYPFMGRETFLAKVQETAELALRTLKASEWSDYNHRWGQHVCCSCGHQSRGKIHAPDCEFTEALAKLQATIDQIEALDVALQKQAEEAS